MKTKGPMCNAHLDFRGKICEKKVHIIHAGKYGSEQLFMEVNRPGYSQSRECSEVDLLGFSPTLR